MDPNTGELSIMISDSATPGDVVEGAITITYPDGSTDQIPVKVLVTGPTEGEPSNPPTPESPEKGVNLSTSVETPQQMRMKQPLRCLQMLRMQKQTQYLQ